jgi:hypothetical protein
MSPLEEQLAALQKENQWLREIIQLMQTQPNQADPNCPCSRCQMATAQRATFERRQALTDAADAVRSDPDILQPSPPAEYSKSIPDQESMPKHACPTEVRAARAPVSEGVTAHLARLDKSHYSVWRKNTNSTNRGYVSGNVPVDSLVAVIEACRELLAEPDAWHQAVLDQCMVAECCYDPTDPRKTLSCLIDWHIHVNIGSDIE